MWSGARSRSRFSPDASDADTSGDAFLEGWLETLMARHAVQGPPILDRIHVDRILADRGGVLSMLGTERANGATVVVKELAQPLSRPLPPADEKRAVWTRLRSCRRTSSRRKA